MGLKVMTLWPRFSVLTPQAFSYRHWGTALPSGRLEPNNLRGQELCAGANSTEAYDGAWGWSDEQCSMPAPSLCKLREWRPLPCLEGVRLVMRAPLWDVPAVGRAKR